METVQARIEKAVDMKEVVTPLASAVFDIAKNCNNPAVQYTLAITEKILGLGEQVPGIGPICSLLNYIVQIEVNAKDVETKCTALVERINFMVGHLAEIQPVNFSKTTEQVLNDIRDTLRDAGALIKTFRKQSSIARRLNMSNKDKFKDAFDAIEQCTSDLMVSLQIHQTRVLDQLHAQMDALAEDGTEAFIAKHGGIDEIKGNEKLVQLFADEFKLAMDEHVMADLNTNITTLLEETRASMESMLKDEVGSAVALGFEQFTAKILQSVNGEQLQCVQCNQVPYKNWGTFECCGNEGPCMLGKHMNRHHFEYPYAAFFDRARKIVGYTDTMDKYSSLKVTALEDDAESQMTLVGKLHKWSSSSSYVSDPLLVVQIGRLKSAGPNWFMVFSKEDLVSAGEKVKETGSLLVHQYEKTAGEYSRADWILDEQGVLCGLRCAVKSSTCAQATIEEVRIDPNTFGLVTVTRISTSHFSFKPQSRYILPNPVVSVGQALPQEPRRKMRTDFKTFGELQPDVMLSFVSKHGLNSRVRTSQTSRDYFEGKLSIFNKSNHPIVIMQLDAEYRLIGDENYTDVCDLEVNLDAPTVIDSFKSIQVTFVFGINRSPQDKALGLRYCNVVSRDRPLRVKFGVKDMEERMAFLITDYVHPFSDLAKKEIGDHAFVFLDDYECITRYPVRFRWSSDQIMTISVPGFDLTLDERKMDMVVHQAEKDGITEVRLPCPDCSEEAFQHTFFALVDTGCRRVYAIKVLLQNEGKGAKMEYISVPDYGLGQDIRPIEYASEAALFPADLRVQPISNFPLDDDVDENLISKFQKIVVSSTPKDSSLSPHKPSNLSGDVQKRLQNIDNNLERAVMAIEGLSGVLKAILDKRTDVPCDLDSSGYPFTPAPSRIPSPSINPPISVAARSGANTSSDVKSRLFGCLE